MAAAVRCEMPDIKRVALVAHDNKKRDLLDWAAFNRDLLGRHALHATGNTGRLLGDQLGLPVTTFRSGPLGGDQQIGARIVDRAIDRAGSRVSWNTRAARRCGPAR